MRYRKVSESRDDEGVIIVFLALGGLLILVGVLAIVIDLGTAYSTSRQMQNSADSAAIAATQELGCVKFITSANPGCDYYPAAASDVAKVASSVATANGAAGNQVTCNVISAYQPNQSPPYSVIGACDNPTSWTPYLNSQDPTHPQADGVYVEAGNTQSTFFGGVTGTKTTSEHRQAAATIQPLAAGTAPLAACMLEGDNANANSGNPPLLIAPPSGGGSLTSFIYGGANNPDPSTEGLGPPNSGPNGTQALGYNVNTAAIGWTYEIHEPSAGQSGKGIDRCGNGSDWKGSVNTPFTIPSWLDGVTGNKTSATRSEIAGACLQVAKPCVLALPICVPNVSGSPPGSYKNPLYCVTFGAFKITSVLGAARVDAIFEGAAPGSGSGGQGNPSSEGINVVNLIQ